MSDLLVEIQDHICTLTINRESKRNAFDDALIIQLTQAFNEASHNALVRVILLKANGKHFSAGADIEWMQRMAHFSFEDNLRDAKALANLMHTIYQCPKPTVVMAQGSTYGGGLGLLAACDIAIAATNAQFCFSEVQLGLIPAAISPFVVEAIGARAAKALFMTAEVFDAEKALSINLIHHHVEESKLLECTLNYARKLSTNAPQAVLSAKKLVQHVANKPIDTELTHYTASLIAHKRVSAEGQKGLISFLKKEKPNWS